jgi:hypothetical protein
MRPDNDGRVWFNDGHGETMAADMAMCKRISEELERLYPGHPWAIGADHAAGTVVIRLMYPAFDNKPWGYMIPLKNIANDADFKRRVMQAGGEWLERWHLAAGRYRETDRGDAMASGLDRS